MKRYRITIISHDDDPSTTMDLTNQEVALIRDLARRIDEAGRSHVSPGFFIEEVEGA